MPKNAVCSTGKKQSPVDINTYEAVLNNTLKPLDRDYNVQKATLVSDGKHVEVFNSHKLILVFILFFCIIY